MPRKGLVVKAVEGDLLLIAKRDAVLAGSALAASALALAREMDASGNSATSKSMCAKELRETMERLRSLAPPAEEADGLDDLATQRERRRQGVAGA